MKVVFYESKFAYITILAYADNLMHRNGIFSFAYIVRVEKKLLKFFKDLPDGSRAFKECLL